MNMYGSIVAVKLRVHKHLHAAYGFEVPPRPHGWFACFLQRVYVALCEFSAAQPAGQVMVSR